jgi:hypothetical protein
MRGHLTEAIQKRAQELLGRPMAPRELKLMPYLQFSVVNNQTINPSRVNPEERGILSKWRAEERIEGGASDELAITKDFWDIINELIWMGYVNHV